MDEGRYEAVERILEESISIFIGIDPEESYRLEVLPDSKYRYCSCLLCTFVMMLLMTFICS